MKLWTLPLTAVVAALIGAGIAVGVMVLWEPWEREIELDETPYVQRLTGAEAAAITRNHLVNTGISGAFGGEGNNGRCEPQEFNDNRRAWIVTCEFIDGNGVHYDTNTFRVDDATTEVEQVLEQLF